MLKPLVALAVLALTCLPVHAQVNPAVRYLDCDDGDDRNDKRTGDGESGEQPAPVRQVAAAGASGRRRFQHRLWAEVEAAEAGQRLCDPEVVTMLVRRHARTS